MEKKNSTHLQIAIIVIITIIAAANTTALTIHLHSHTHTRAHTAHSALAPILEVGGLEQFELVAVGARGQQRVAFGRFAIVERERHRFGGGAFVELPRAPHAVLRLDNLGSERGTREGNEFMRRKKKRS